MSVTPTDASGASRVRGVDWAKDDHAVCIVDADGRGRCDRFMIAHDAGGLKDWSAACCGRRRRGRDRTPRRADRRRPAPGRARRCWSSRPSQLKNLRSRYGSAGNKDDRFDAYVLADVVRTDRRRLGRWPATAPATTALRTTRAAPAATWSSTASPRPTSCARTCRSCSPARQGFSPRSTPRSAWRSWNASPPKPRPTGSRPKRLGAWLAIGRYSGRIAPAVLHARLLAAPRGTTGPEADTHAAHHPGLRRSPAHPEHPDPRPRRPHRRPARRPPRRAHLHLPAPLRDPPGRPAAGRDRRRPRTVPHRGLAGLPGRRRPLDPPVRQGQGRHLPLGRRQTTPRRALRLRRRLPPRQPLGRRPLQPARARGHDHPHAVRILARAWATSSGAAGKTTPPTTPPHRALQRILNQHHKAA